jgi:thymidylate kinase
MRRINVFGGPGIGKSTVAAQLFARLKTRGFEVELVNEWIKAWAWQGIKPTGFDQLYNFAKQLRREEIVLRHGGLVVSDAPLMMQLAYVRRYAAQDMLWLAADLSSIADSYEHRYPSLNIMLTRSKTRPYQQLGRFQNEHEAIELDNDIEKVLNAKLISYTRAYADEIDLIEDHVVRNLHKENDDDRVSDMVRYVSGGCG